MKKIISIFTLFTVMLLSACSVKTDSQTGLFPGIQYETNPTETTEKTVTDAPLTEIFPPEIALEEPKEVRISFLAAGDNVIHPCIYMDAQRRATEETRPYNFKPMYSDVSDYIASFDIAFINQETLMCGEGFALSGYPNFNSPQDLGLDLRDIGFDIINMANNHTYDKGLSGLKATIDFYNSEEMSGVTTIGGYLNWEDYDNIRIVEKEGITIALLSYTYDTNRIFPSTAELVIPFINEADIIRQSKIAEEIADITVCSVHWGIEHHTTPSAEQKKVAKLLAENGVDVILGHHPHVLQPIEIIETEKGPTLCIYSLGNILSAMQNWQNMVGGFFTFDIVRNTVGEVTFDNPKFTPTAFYYGPSYFNSHLYFLKDYTAEKAKTHGTANLYGSYASPSDMLSFAEKIMGDYLNFDGFNE